MRWIIRGIAYDTEAAEEVFQATHGDDAPSQQWWSLYRNAAGAFFEVYSDHNGVFDGCRPLSDQEAQDWLELNANYLVEKYFGPLPEASPTNSPMSIEKRRLVLAGTKMLKALGHTGFESMLLEFGAPEDVGSGSGLLARANSLARYVLSNPDAQAYDRSLLSDAIIKRARAVYERGQTNNISDEERHEFGEASAVFDSTAFAADLVKPPSVLDQVLGAVPAVVSAPHAARPKARRKVFIVHGHDPGPREAVARFLERIDFEPVILHERPNKGRTIITKFQQEAADVGFAVVLMTPDDPGLKGEGSPGRSRQNVVFELGFFIGVLGPERVAAVVKGDVEKPSDFDGVMYIQFDSGDGWKLTLARELEAAGFDVDLNKARSQ